MKLPLRLFFFALVLIQFQESIAQYEDCRLRNLTYEDGIINEDAEDILEDHNGFLWIASYNGLVKWDGTRADHYTFSHSDSSGLWNNICRTIYEDKDNNLWAGTIAGVNRYNPDSDQFERFSFSKTQHPNSPTNAFLEDQNGTLWIGTSDGLFFRNPNNGSLESINSITKTPFQSLDIFDLELDVNGNIWMATFHNGVVKFDPRSYAFEEFKHKPGDPNTLCSNLIKSILVTQGQQIWCGSAESGISVMDTTGRIIQQLKPKAVLANGKPAEQEIIYDLYEDTQGIIWIGVKDQPPFTYNLETKVLKVFHKRAINNDRQICSSVYHFTEDDFGNMWFATAGNGLFSFNTKNTLFSARYAFDSPSNIATCFGEDPEGQIWIGSEKGVYPFYQQSNKNHLTDVAVLDLESDRFGEIWSVGWKAGLHRWNPNTGNQQVWKHSDTDSTSLITDDIKSLAIQDSIIWLGTHGEGLAVYLRKENRFIDHRNNDYFNFNLSDPGWVNHLFLDQKDRLWISTYSGVFLVTGKEIQKFRYASQPGSISCNEINMITEDQAGIIWIGTDSGLERFDEASGKFENWSDMYELPMKIKHLICDEQDIYLGTESGLIVINQQSKKVTSYPEEFGLHGRFFTQKAAFENSKGQVFMGGHQGFTFFHPTDLIQDGLSPKFYFRSLKINGEVQEPSRVGSLINRRLQSEDTLVLAYDQTHIQLEFSIINHFARESILLQYRISNVIDNWSPLSVSEGLNIPQLSSGKYEISFRNSTHNGEWATAVNRLFITVKPPWWNTLGFKIGLAISLFVLFYAFYRARMKSIKRRNQLLKTTVDQRTKELNDSNTTLLERNDEITQQNEQLHTYNEKFRRQYLKILNQQASLFRQSREFNLALDVLKKKGGDNVHEVIETVQQTRQKLANIEQGGELSAEFQDFKVAVFVADSDQKERLTELLSVSLDLTFYHNTDQLKSQLEQDLPDIILTDENQPDLCEWFRKELTTSHIPIIVVRKTDSSFTNSSLNTIVDYHVSEADIETTLRDIIVKVAFRQDQIFKSLFHENELFEDASTLNIQDRKFLQRVLEVIESHISDPEFDSSKLCDLLSMSRSVLYAKVKTLTGQGVNEFIKSVRLKTSIELLKSGNYRINEIAYEVGFSSPSYFNRNFKRVYDMSPKEYLAKLKGDKS